MSSFGLDLKSPAPPPFWTALALIPHEPLKAMVSLRSHLFDEGGRDKSEILKYSGCLLSFDEARPKAPRGSKTPAEARLLAMLRRLVAMGMANDSTTVDEASAAIIAAREVAAILRRIWIADTCRANGQPLAAALALFRQESALMVTPAVSSYSHAPLIESAENDACRPETVSLWDNHQGYCRRPGENLVYAINKTTDVNQRSELALSFDIAIRNVAVVGGLDTILLPRLQAGDELGQLLAAVAAGTVPSRSWSRFHTDVRSHLSGAASRWFSQRFGSQRSLALSFVTGFAMKDLDLVQQPPDPEDLVDAATAGVWRTIDVHRVELRNVSGTTYSTLVGQDDYTATRVPLEIQQSWFASRAQRVTILGRLHRPAHSSGAGRFSSFVTYLRYNLGDAMFAGTLLRVAVALQRLVNRWRAYPSWGTVLLRDGAATRWLANARSATGRAAQAQLERALGHWVSSVGNESAWRHHGLLATWGPGHLVPATRGPDRRIEATANAIAAAFVVLSDAGLFDVLDLALEFTPIDHLVQMDLIAIQDPVSARKPLARAHSFERLRIAYEGKGVDALAGLEPR